MAESQSGSEDVRAEVDALKEDITKLRSDLSGLAETMKAAGRERAGHARDRLEEELEERLEQLRSGGERAYAYGRQRVDDVGHRVEENPFTFVAGAFGIGLLIGWILRR